MRTIVLTLFAAFAASLAAAQAAPDAVNPRNPIDAIAYFHVHAHNIAMVVYTVGEDGEPVEDGHSIFHNPDEPMPLASTVKIAILAAYAREVAAGRINPDDQVQVAEWELYYLPGTDGGAHAAALEEMRFASTPDGFAMDQALSVRIDRIVGAMMRHSDNAAADLLLRRIGRQAIEDTLRKIGVEFEFDMISFLGLFLYWENHERSAPSDAEVRTLIDLDPVMRQLEMRRLQNAYLTDDWREAELRWRRERQPDQSDILRQATFADHIGPRASARDVARFLALTASDSLLSPEASKIVRRHMEWPMRQPGMRRSFDILGAKGGALAGAITDASYLSSRHGDFQDQMRISVLLMRRVPMESWIAMMSSFAHQQAAFAAGVHPGFLTAIQKSLAGEDWTARPDDVEEAAEDIDHPLPR